MRPDFEAVVMGVSAGGLEALRNILPSLPGDFPLSVIIVQHRHPNSDHYMITSLNKHCQLKVKEVDEKETAEQGVIYIAPPNYHLLIETDRSFSLSTSEPVQHARPAVDVLFETAAEAYGSQLIGVILTGANSDGSAGLKCIKERGGLAIVQDPATAAVDFMPKAALAATEVDYVLKLEEIGPFLAGMKYLSESASATKINSH